MYTLTEVCWGCDGDTVYPVDDVAPNRDLAGTLDVRTPVGDPAVVPLSRKGEGVQDGGSVGRDSQHGVPVVDMD